jgi:hypothetical protein
MDDYELKSPEQLIIGDIIPSWGNDFVVRHTVPVTGNTSYRVSFEGGEQVDYPVGTAIKVLRK